MDKKTIEFLKSFLEIPSPSGFEYNVQKLFVEYIKPYVDKIETDVHGNVFAIKNPDGKPSLMLAAHCDEIGLMVKYITEEGFIYFVPIGGMSSTRLEGMRVFIHTKNGPIPGVIARKPLFIRQENGKDNPAKFQDLWIDIGAKNKQDAMADVSLGDCITIATGFQILKNNLATSRGFDDKIGVFVIAETLRNLKKEKIDCAVFGVSTVQEEVGSKGVWGVTYKLKPDLAIVVEVEHASDHPDSEKQQTGEIYLGKGIGFNRGPNINPYLNEFMIKIAEEENIPYHLNAIPGPTSTDASVIHIIREGIPCALLRIPLRYMHTPSEVISIDDVDSAIKFLITFIRKLNISQKWKLETDE